MSLLLLFIAATVIQASLVSGILEINIATIANMTNTTLFVISDQAFLAPHNQVRFGVSPVAVPSLPSVTLSTLMTSYATTFVQACVYKHGGPNFGSYGQNIYASIGGIPTATGIVNAWAAENRFYNYQTNTCEVGKQCSHYTQVVWRKSVTIGCAVKQCTVNSPFHTAAPWYFAVCNYAPHGNFVGERPY